MPRLDGPLRLSVPERLRDRHLPWREQGFAIHRLVVRDDGVALLRVGQSRPEAGLLRRLLVDMDQHVLEIRLLAPDAVDADAAGDVPDQAQARPRLHRLLLPGVAGEHHLGPVALRELQDVMRLAGRQHPRLVHHDQCVAADLDLPLRRELQQLVDAPGARVAVVAERHRRPPGDGGGHDLVAVLPVKVGDGTQCGGLARSRRALDHRHASALYRRMADRQRLLLAQRITLLDQGLDLPYDRLFRQAVAGIGGHGCRHVLHRLLQTQVVPGGIDLGVDHAGTGFGGRLPGLKPLDLGVAAQPLDGRPHRVPAHQTRRRVRRRLHHVRTPEHGFLAREVGGQIVEPVGQLPDGFARDIHLMAGDGFDRLRPHDEAVGLVPPAPVSHLRIVVVRLPLARELVDAGHARCVAQ